TPVEVPLWSGLRLHAVASRAAGSHITAPTGLATKPPLALKDVETAMIHQAVTQAKGNVMQAALALGISRATVYRKLGNKNRP
ncbi:MAG TPA: helix-turn-helix domain-containing protein, partial [Burkholderiaceae bacterium]|nr:helix-turn-helix domain-containing protein [Burkholderiaceae bacterium]